MAWEYLIAMEKGVHWYAFGDDGHAYITKNVQMVGTDEKIVAYRSSRPQSKIGKKFVAEPRMYFNLRKSNFKEWFKFE